MGVDVEERKIGCLIDQINAVTKELRDQILPDLRSKLKSILYSLHNGECKEIPDEAVRGGSLLLTALEEHRRDLVDISNMILDIDKQIDL